MADVSIPVRTTITVAVRYFAAAKTAAGTATESVDVRAGTTLEALVGLLAERHGAELARVLPRCSFLLDEVAVRDTARQLPGSATVDVLPPFAGG